MSFTTKYTPPVLIEDLGMIFLTTKSKKRVRYGLYKCQCGVEYRAQTASVKSGRSKSCGCYMKEVNSIKCKKQITHGMTNTRLYKTWRSIKNRTTNPNYTQTKDYIGRGIIVCTEWANSFEAFQEWAMSNGYSDELSIDRINNDGNYEPSNCRWATYTEQMCNTRILSTKNTSGYRGVSKSGDKWMARIKRDGKEKYLGTFNSPLEAASAYDKYVLDNNLEHTINGVLL